MVKIAVAGGTGNVATEILRTPIASGNHNITIFTRSTAKEIASGVSCRQVDYSDRASLTEALKGFDVCLSFMVVHLDKDSVTQKNLIHACIDAGVRRFAPSEWGIKNNSGIPEYANKDAIAEYLQDINRESKVLEYSLFQPSIFMEYFAHPYPRSPGLHTWPFFVDFNTRHAIVLDKGDQPIVITAIADISETLNLALNDEKPWPVEGGMRGARTSINELLALGKRLRPGEWTVEHVKGEDIERGELKTKWVPQMSHPIIPPEKRAAYSSEFTVSFFKGILRGAWDVNDEFNKRYPDFKFQSAEEYLTKVWKGRENE